MKKITKKSLDELAQRMPVITNTEMQYYIASTGALYDNDPVYNGTFNIAGGKVENYTSYQGDKYAVVSLNNGSAVVLVGIHVGNETLPFQQNDTAVYFNNKIGVSPSWTSFNISNLMHEYGHYLQSKEKGSLEYAVGATGSVLDIAFGGSGHDEMPFEKEATNNGNSYYQEYSWQWKK